MAIDYIKLANRAKVLVGENGRALKIIRFNKTAADPTKPWKGPTDPRTDVEISADIVGAFMPLSNANRLGITVTDIESLKRTKEFFLVAPGADNPPFDLSTADEIIDNGQHYKITFVEVMRPSEFTLLYYIGTER